MNTLVKTLGSHAARKAAEKHIGVGAAIDPKRGWAMLRDRNIPAGSKATALLLGAALTGVLVACEVPLEAVIGFFLPLAGVAVDSIFDGAELILGPLLFASIAMPFLVPKPVEVRVPIAPTPEPRLVSGR